MEVKNVGFCVLKYLIWNPGSGTSLVVQWLGLCTFSAEGQGLIPGGGIKIPQVMQCSQNK